MTAITTTNPRPTTTTPGRRLDQVLAGLGARAEALGGHALRYGLVLVLLWIGGMKFTAYEAQGIRPFVENSPPFAWTYPVFGVQGLSNILGDRDPGRTSDRRPPVAPPGVGRRQLARGRDVPGHPQLPRDDPGGLGR